MQLYLHNANTKILRIQNILYISAKLCIYVYILHEYKMHLLIYIFIEYICTHTPLTSIWYVIFCSVLCIHILYFVSLHARVLTQSCPWGVARQAPRPWDFPGKNTGVGCHFPQGIFLPQGWKLHLLFLLHGKVASFTLEPPGKPLWKFIHCYILCIIYRLFLYHGTHLNVTISEA